MPKPLDGQVAIVTGAGRGIGRAIALALAAAGARVAAAARSSAEIEATAEAIQRKGGVAFPTPVDIRNWSSVEAMVSAVSRDLGPVDVLVQNAGSVGPVAPIWETDPQAWAEVVQTNLIGTYHCVRAVLPQMLARRSGRIITLMGGRVGMQARRYFTAYESSKAGVIWFTEGLAREAAEHGISVFAINPGAVPTVLAHEIARSPWVQSDLNKGEAAVAATFATPPERAAALCQFLAEGHADDLSGSVFSAALGDNLAPGEADSRSLRWLRGTPPVPQSTHRTP